MDARLTLPLPRECKSTRRMTISSALQYDEWHGFLGNKPLVDALLSRVRERCHTVKIDGPSLREQQS